MKSKREIEDMIIKSRFRGIYFISTAMFMVLSQFLTPITGTSISGTGLKTYLTFYCAMNFWHWQNNLYSTIARGRRACRLEYEQNASILCGLNINFEV